MPLPAWAYIIYVIFVLCAGIGLPPQIKGSSMEWHVFLLRAVGLMLLLFATGLPIFLSFLFLNLLGIFYITGSLKGVLLVINSMYDTSLSMSLAAIPLFVLLGEILFRSNAVGIVFN